MESLSASRLFVQLDLASGYLQIPLTAEAAEKTAFITADTTGQFTRMPFGLSGAVAEFTRLMKVLLGPLDGRVVRNYLDDMVIDAEDWADMLVKLRLVLGRLREAKLTLKPGKCSFGASRIEFLGFVIEDGTIRPGTEKTRAIAEFPRPTDVHGVRRFLGLTGFFRRFVGKYADTAAPLTLLTRKGAIFVWGAEQERAFVELRDGLVREPVLAMFRADAAVTELHTDASAVGLGAMLLQSADPGGTLKLVYCISRKTSDAETRYHSSKLELLSIVWATHKLRAFLLGVPFTVVTDCQALVYLNSCKGSNAHVARWHDALQDYDYSIKYRPGVRMGHVDALSRAPVDVEDQSTGDVLAGRYDVCTMMTERERVSMCQAADEAVRRVKEEVESGSGNHSVLFEVCDGLLFRKFQSKLLFVMPKSMRKSLVVVAHDLSGHPAVDRTVSNLLQDYWFLGMRRYVKQHIRMCFECLLSKNPRGRRPGLLHPVPLGRRPFETVHVDHVGPFVTTKEGNRYVIVFVDNLTKFVVLYSVANTSAEALLEKVQVFTDNYGLPGRFVTDRGTCYTAASFERFCNERGIGLIRTSSSTRRQMGK